MSLIPFLGDKSARKRLDEIFSRKTLGSIFIGVSGGKVIEKTINLLFDTTLDLLFGWFVAFWIFVLLFIFWDRIEREIQEQVE